MSTTVQRRVVPLLFGFAMLAILVAVGLSANTGALKADSSCPYGSCTTSTTSGSTPLWAWAAIGVIVFLAVLVTALLVLRRRRPPPSTDVPPGVEPAGTFTGGPPGATEPSEPSTPEAVPSYVEGPEDVAAPAPELPAAATGAAAGGAVAAAAVPEPEAGAGSTNIDDLMDELDRISGEMLKKDKPKGPGGKPPDDPGTP